MQYILIIKNTYKLNIITLRYIYNKLSNNNIIIINPLKYYSLTSKGILGRMGNGKGKRIGYYRIYPKGKIFAISNNIMPKLPWFIQRGIKK